MRSEHQMVKNPAIAHTGYNEFRQPHVFECRDSPHKIMQQLRSTVSLNSTRYSGKQKNNSTVLHTTRADEVLKVGALIRSPSRKVLCCNRRKVEHCLCVYMYMCIHVSRWRE